MCDKIAKKKYYEKNKLYFKKKRHERYLNNKEYELARNKKWEKENSEHSKKKKKEYIEKNKEKVKEIHRNYYLSTKEQQLKKRKERYRLNKEYELARNRKWHDANLDVYKKGQKEYRLNNKDKSNACTRKHRLQKIKSCPSWLTEEEHQQIAAVYKLAKELAWLNSDFEPFQVDHIVPLQGKNVCGLHVPWNLQLLTKTENRSKGNKF